MICGTVVPMCAHDDIHIYMTCKYVCTHTELCVYFPIGVFVCVYFICGRLNVRLAIRLGTHSTQDTHQPWSSADLLSVPHWPSAMLVSIWAVWSMCARGRLLCAWAGADIYWMLTGIQQ